MPGVRMLHVGGLECVPVEPDDLKDRDGASTQSFVAADDAERTKGERFEVGSGNENGWRFLLDRSGVTENSQCVKAGCKLS